MPGTGVDVSDSNSPIPERGGVEVECGEKLGEGSEECRSIGALRSALLESSSSSSWQGFGGAIGRCWPALAAEVVLLVYRRRWCWRGGVTRVDPPGSRRTGRIRFRRPGCHPVGIGAACEAGKLSDATRGSIGIVVYKAREICPVWEVGGYRRCSRTASSF